MVGYIGDGSPGQRAVGLLRAHLNEEQREDFDRNSRVEVVTKMRRFWRWQERRFRISLSGAVTEIRDGRRVREYCIHFASPARYDVASVDQLLALKLMLETDPKRFLRVANVLPPWPD